MITSILLRKKHKRKIISIIQVPWHMISIETQWRNKNRLEIMALSFYRRQTTRVNTNWTCKHDRHGLPNGHLKSSLCTYILLQAINPLKCIGINNNYINSRMNKIRSVLFFGTHIVFSFRNYLKIYFGVGK